VFSSSSKSLWVNYGWLELTRPFVSYKNIGTAILWCLVSLFLALLLLTIPLSRLIPLVLLCLVSCVNHTSTSVSGQKVLCATLAPWILLVGLNITTHVDESLFHSISNPYIAVEFWRSPAVGVPPRAVFRLMGYPHHVLLGASHGFTPSGYAWALHVADPHSLSCTFSNYRGILEHPFTLAICWAANPAHFVGH